MEVLLTVTIIVTLSIVMTAAESVLNSKFGKWAGCLMWAVWCWTFFLLSLFTLSNSPGDLFWKATTLLMAIFWTYLFWKNRPRKKLKRLSDLIGEKTKAIFARMAEAMKAPPKLAHNLS